VLQGVGGGLILPIGQLMMARAAGPERMGRVMGIVSVPAMLGPILGPTLGGLIVDNTSWRWIFYVNVPVGVVAFVLGLRLLPHGDREETDPLDLRGLALMTIGLPLLTYGLAEVGATGGFDTTHVVAPLVGGALLLGAFALHALHVPRPLLDLRLYRRGTFSSASIAMFCLGAALFGSMILLPLYWQQIRGESVVDTGLLTAPTGFGMALVMPLAGRLADRFGGGPLSLIGVLVTAAATVPFGLIGTHTSITWLCVAMFVRGIGVGLAFMPAMSAAFAALKPAELSDATPQLNVIQRVGGSIGTAVLAVVLQRALAGANGLSAQAGAYGAAFWWTTALTAAAVVPCLVLVRAERRARVERAGAELDDVDGAVAIAEAVA
jgi:EmrB/QacA subfamily drug resistance transporter